MSWNDEGWRRTLARVTFPAGASEAARELIGASFRGGGGRTAVPFYVSSSEHSTGRRGVTHEYPGREEPYREDMGRATRTFSVEGYVLGDNYVAARDQLLAELERPGVGELKHPYYGVRSVAVGDVRVRETVTDGGMAVFSIDFIETPAQPVEPTATLDALAGLLARVPSVRQKLREQFLAAYKPGTWQDRLAGALRSASGGIASGLVLAHLAGESAARAHRDVTRLSNNAAALVASPATVLETLVGVFDHFPIGAWRGVLTAYGFNPGPRPSATTPAGAAEQASFDALRQVIQRLALVRAVELAAQDSFGNYEAAIAAREYLLDLLDEQAQDAEDAIYPALVQLRADLIRALPGDASGLPRLRSYTPPQTVPSLVLAHDLYGALGLEGDILTRNRVEHPAFIPGGQPLEVLSDD